MSQGHHDPEKADLRRAFDDMAKREEQHEAIRADLADDNARLRAERDEWKRNCMVIDGCAKHARLGLDAALAALREVYTLAHDMPEDWEFRAALMDCVERFVKE